MKKVTIYSDGACRRNGQPDNIGAYGIVLMHEKEDGTLLKREISEGFKNVTNNQMELSGVIEGLSLLKYPCEVDLYTDSKYVCDAINKKWLEGWVKKNWINSQNKPVKNKELWQMLIPLLETHKVTITHVKGHADNFFNNRCDELCNIKMDEMEE